VTRLYLSPQPVPNLTVCHILDRQEHAEGAIVRTIGLVILDPQPGGFAPAWRLVILSAPYCDRWRRLDGMRIGSLSAFDDLEGRAAGAVYPLAVA
jgi:hypothetical protein